MAFQGDIRSDRAAGCALSAPELKTRGEEAVLYVPRTSVISQLFTKQPRRVNGRNPQASLVEPSLYLYNGLCDIAISPNLL